MARAEPLVAAPNAEAAPVVGELVEGQLDAVIPSADQQAKNADRAVGRTTIQVGLPSAVVAIGTWAARLAGIDLNPLPKVEDMPPEIVAAFIVVFTVLLARRMNPKPSTDG